jgi:hypothetical protein
LDGSFREVLKADFNLLRPDDDFVGDRLDDLGLTLAHQHLHQLEPDIRHAVLGNAGTLISFRVGPEDATVLAQELQPVFGVEDLLNLPNRHFYLKLMIDGTPSRPFSARTLELDD